MTEDELMDLELDTQREWASEQEYTTLYEEDYDNFTNED